VRTENTLPLTAVVAPQTAREAAVPAARTHARTHSRLQPESQEVYTLKLARVACVPSQNLQTFRHGLAGTLEVILSNGPSALAVVAQTTLLATPVIRWVVSQTAAVKRFRLETRTLHHGAHIGSMTKPRRMRWTGQVARTEN
jgi:hypothetical protein